MLKRNKATTPINGNRFSRKISGDDNFKLLRTTTSQGGWMYKPL